MSLSVIFADITKAMQTIGLKINHKVKTTVVVQDIKGSFLDSVVFGVQIFLQIYKYINTF